MYIAIIYNPSVLQTIKFDIELNKEIPTKNNNKSSFAAKVF